MASRTRKKGPARGARRGATAARRGKATARPKKVVKAKATRRPKATSTRKAPARKPVAARPTGNDKQLAALRTRFEREKRALEGQLTDSIREIGQLRHHEMRVTQLERELKERDDAIAQLRRELEQLRRHADTRRSDLGGQQSLALGEGGRELDEFDDVALDEDELI